MQLGKKSFIRLTGHHQGKSGQELKPVAWNEAETRKECCFLDFSVFPLESWRIPGELLVFSPFCKTDILSSKTSLYPATRQKMLPILGEGFLLYPRPSIPGSVLTRSSRNKSLIEFQNSRSHQIVSVLTSKLVSFCQLDIARVAQEDGISIEELLPSDWSSVGRFAC